MWQVVLEALPSNTSVDQAGEHFSSFVITSENEYSNGERLGQPKLVEAVRFLASLQEVRYLIYRLIVFSLTELSVSF